MVQEIKNFFTGYCKRNKLKLIVKEIKVAKLDYVYVKIAQPEELRSISIGFFPNYTKEQTEERKVDFLLEADRLFKIK